MHWRRKRQPTPVSLPGKSQGPGSLVGCRLRGRTESDTTQRRHFHHYHFLHHQHWHHYQHHHRDCHQHPIFITIIITFNNVIPSLSWLSHHHYYDHYLPIIATPLSSSLSPSPCLTVIVTTIIAAISSMLTTYCVPHT